MQHKWQATEKFLRLLKQQIGSHQIHSNMNYEICVVKAKAWFLQQQNFATHAMMEQMHHAWGRCQNTVTPQWNATATFHIPGSNFI
jgi:hypothetical protein